MSDAECSSDRSKTRRRSLLISPQSYLNRPLADSVSLSYRRVTVIGEDQVLSLDILTAVRRRTCFLCVFAGFSEGENTGISGSSQKVKVRQLFDHFSRFLQLHTYVRIVWQTCIYFPCPPLYWYIYSVHVHV